jgi:hypothetical protein
MSKLDGLVNQPKLERIQFLELTLIDRHMFHLRCNNIYLIELRFETVRSMTHVNDLHLLVMQDRFGILQFIYYCLCVKLNLFN